MGQRGDFERCHDWPAFGGKGKFREVQLGGFFEIRERLLKGLSLRGRAGLGIMGDEPIAVGIGIDNGGEVERFLTHNVNNVYPIYVFPAKLFWHVRRAHRKMRSTMEGEGNRVGI